MSANIENIEKIKPIIEAIIFAADQPSSVSYLHGLLQAEDENIERDDVRAALAQLQQESEQRGIELLELASGYQYRVRTEFSSWLSKLWEERPPRYSRALLETLALIIYRQPVTRAEIEEVRGVAVSSHIIRTLLEREWVKIIGYKDVPGKPALFATTKQLLDYFNLKSLKDLPPLEALVNLDEAGEQLEISLQENAENHPESQLESQLENQKAQEAPELEALTHEQESLDVESQDSSAAQEEASEPLDNSLEASGTEGERAIEVDFSPELELAQQQEELVIEEESR